MTIGMERPYKRRRLSDPPEIELHYRRERNDRRLKSTFESIFEKYGKDFGGIGDEIDLETGEIVVNNGHVLGMANERDVGDDEPDWEEFRIEEWSDDEGILTSSLLSETRERIDALRYGGLRGRVGWTDEDAESGEDVHSLSDDNDSLMGDMQPKLPIPIMQANAPDSRIRLDDETEDELASTDVEWPTPGKAWPTPKPPTPLSHTPWHSSPIKSVYRDNSPIDPTWRAPSLPEDNELREFNSPTNRLKKRETEDLDLRRLSQKQSIQVLQAQSPSCRESTIISPSHHMKSFKRRKSGRSIETTLPSKRVGGKNRWTDAEENLLRQLRSMEGLMYSNIKPYFPGRAKQAIMLHWSRMTRRDRDLSGFSDLIIPSADSPLPSRDSFIKFKDRGCIGETRKRKHNPHATEPASRGIQKSSKEIPDPAVLKPMPPAEASSPKVIGQTASPLLDQEIPNSSDPSEELQQPQLLSLSANISSSNPAPRFYHKTPPPKDSGTERSEEKAIVKTVTPPGALSPSRVETRVLQSPDKILDSSPRSARRSRSESTKTASSAPVRTSRSTSKTSLSTGQASECRQERPLASRKAVFLPSYPADVSDDELSVPIKTVGSCQNQKRRASSQMLSDIVLK